MDRQFEKARGKMGELPYWSRAESRNSQGRILKVPRERAKTIYTRHVSLFQGRRSWQKEDRNDAQKNRREIVRLAGQKDQKDGHGASWRDEDRGG
jgi:hypothetical protein